MTVQEGGDSVDESEQGERANEYLGRGEAVKFLIAGLLLTLSFALIPIVVVGIIANSQGRAYGAVLSEVACVLQPLLNDFMSLAAVVATLLLALAAATNFGRGSHSLNVRARFAITVIVLICIFSVTIAAAATVVVAVDDAREWTRVVPAIAIAWACLLVGQVVGTGATPELRARAAKREWKQRRELAKSRGVYWKMPRPTRRSTLVAELLFWGVPIALWILAVTVILASGGAWGQSDSAYSFGMSVILFSGNLLMMAGWRLSSDLSVSSQARAVQSLSPGLVGLLASVVLASVLISTATLAPFGWALVAFTGAIATALLVPSIRRWLWPVQVLETASTLRALSEVRRRKDRVRSELRG